jgi:hypothetical protein
VRGGAWVGMKDVWELAERIEDGMGDRGQSSPRAVLMKRIRLDMHVHVQVFLSWT